MSVTINVLSVDNLNIQIECINDSNGNVIMRSPVRIKQKTKASIENAIRDQFKAFNQPVWGGMSIVFYVSI